MMTWKSKSSESNACEMDEGVDITERFKVTNDIGIYEAVETLTKEDSNMPSASPYYYVEDMMEFFLPEFKGKDANESCGTFQTTVSLHNPGYPPHPYTYPPVTNVSYTNMPKTPRLLGGSQATCSRNDLFSEYEPKSRVQSGHYDTVDSSSIRDMDTSRLVEEFQCKADTKCQSKAMRSPESCDRQSPLIFESILNESKFSPCPTSYIPKVNSPRSWTCKHPENWTTHEVLDWLYDSAELHGIDCGLLRGEAFQIISGKELCQMQLIDFERLEPHYGGLFCDLFHYLCSGFNFSKPSEMKSLKCSEYSPKQPLPDYTEPSMDSDNPSDFENIFCSLSEFNNCEPEPKTMVTGPSLFELLREKKSDEDQNMGSISTKDTAFNRVEESVFSAHSQMNHQITGTLVNDYSARQSPQRCVIRSSETIPVRRKPGRPRIKTYPTEADSQTKKDKKVKIQHLWEFIYGVLMNPSYNPQYLRWENQREGVFRFVQSEAVAHLWGSLKNNENMTYEKLSRAMRHYYKRGILERVEGRRLVYKFSRRAIDKCREKIRLNTI